MKGLDIAIVGAGLGGLCAAIALLRDGHRVRIYEQAEELGEVGAGISIAPNAAKALNSLGLHSQLAAISNRPSEGRIFDGRTGEQLSVTPFGETLRAIFGDYYYQLHRADLHRILVEAALKFDSECLFLNRKLVDTQEKDGAIELAFEDETVEASDVLIAADGIRSVVRPKIAGEDQVRFTRFVAWRAVIPLNRLPSDYNVPISNVWIGPERNCTFYPMRHGECLNCVMFAGDSDWTGEDWRDTASVEEIRAAFDGYSDRITTIIDAIDEQNCYKWALYDREPIQKWVTPRAVLLGDAAHPMLPFLGQGASMAIEDAVTLAFELKQKRTIEDAFSGFVKRRQARANYVLMESRNAGARFAYADPSTAVFEGDKAMQTGTLFQWDPPGFSDR